MCVECVPRPHFMCCRLCPALHADNLDIPQRIRLAVQWVVVSIGRGHCRCFVFLSHDFHRITYYQIIVNVLRLCPMAVMPSALLSADWTNGHWVTAPRSVRCIPIVPPRFPFFCVFWPHTLSYEFAHILVHQAPPRGLLLESIVCPPLCCM